MHRSDVRNNHAYKILRTNNMDEALSDQEICRRLSEAVLMETKKPLADMDHELIGSCLHLRGILHCAQKAQLIEGAE